MGSIIASQLAVDTFGEKNVKYELALWSGVFCFADNSENAATAPSEDKFLFPEYEIVIESEEPEFPADDDDDEGAAGTSKEAEEQEEHRVSSSTGKKHDAASLLNEVCITSLKYHMLLFLSVPSKLLVTKSCSQ